MKKKIINRYYFLFIYLLKKFETLKYKILKRKLKFFSFRNYLFIEDLLRIFIFHDGLLMSIVNC